MRNPLRAAVLSRSFFVAVAVMLGNSPTPAQDAARYGWHTDYQAALKIARAENKPLMVVFRCVP